MLITMTCPMNSNGEYIARELEEEQNLENLKHFSDRLAEMHQRMNPAICECK